MGASAEANVKRLSIGLNEKTTASSFSFQLEQAGSGSIS